MRPALKTPAAGVRLPTLYSTIDDQVATVVLDRPHVLNCANEQSVVDLHAAIDDIATDERLRIVVIRGAGRAFCTGIDLTALSEGEISPAFFRGWEEALRRLETLDAIVIAALHSHCLGGGLQLALACDLRIARDDARIGVTAVHEGIIPGLGMWRIARFAGLGRAKRLALAAEVIDARNALHWGLVDEVASADAFDERIREYCQRLLAMGRTAARLSKKLTNLAVDASFADVLETFCEYQREAIASPEHRAAMSERRERRARRLAVDR